MSEVTSPRSIASMRSLWSHYRLHYCNFTYSFQTWVLQFAVFESRLPANQPNTTYSHFNSTAFFSFRSFWNSAKSFHSFIRSCHPPASFQSISAQNYWQILLPRAPALWNSLPEHLRALSSTSPSQANYSLSFHCLPLNSTNNWKPTFSFNPILSGLTRLNSTRLDLPVIHTPFYFSFISTSFIAWVFLFYTGFRKCTGIRISFLSALWCTVNLPHSLTISI